MKKIIATDAAPLPVGPYSQAVLANGFLFCSGQVALDPKTQTVVSGGVTEQTHQVLANIEAVLKKADCSWDHIVKTTIFLTNMADFATVNEIYAKKFSSNPPARSTVQVSALPKNVSVEIEVTACVG